VITDEDLTHLRAAVDLAAAARARGDDPFGARVVADGRVLADGGNLVHTTGDVTAHAEVVALRALGAASGPALGGATLYASGEPCAMCAAAIAWAGVGRVVFAVEATRILALDGDAPTAPAVPGREILERSGRRSEHAATLAAEAEARLWPGTGRGAGQLRTTSD
jgi:tRNA(Arg) A34 adenosine deaminase TadA